MVEITNPNEEKSGAEIYLDPDTHKFKKGNPGGGRPKGSVSIMTEIKNYLEDHPEKLDELMHYYIDNERMRELLWKMLDGMPKQKLGLEADEMITELTIKVVNPKQDETNNQLNNRISEITEGVSGEET